MLGVITSEAPFLRWIGPHIPLKRVQKLFNGEDLIFEHGSVAVQNMRTDSANSQNLFGQMLAQADSQEKTGLTDDTVSDIALRNPNTIETQDGLVFTWRGCSRAHVNSLLTGS